jgi:hypothetical protein
MKYGNYYNSFGYVRLLFLSQNKHTFHVLCAVYGDDMFAAACAVIFR